MGLLINQGKQNTSMDNTFEPIIQNDATMVVSEIKLDEYNANTLKLTYRILDGNNKNRFVYDRVCYDPNDKNSWKYRSLRMSANCPYQENEPAQIDIEDLLLNKVITADLGEREGKDREGNPKKFQSIKYKKTIISVDTTPAGLIEEETSDTGLPFKETTANSATVAIKQAETTQEVHQTSMDDEW